MAMLTETANSMLDTVQQMLGSLASTFAQKVVMDFYCKLLQSMVSGEAFCQDVCLVVTLLNIAVNVVTHNAQENALQVAHYIGGCSGWKQ